MQQIIRTLIFLTLSLIVVVMAYRHIMRVQHENEVLKQVVSRLEADSRVAEVMVTGVNFNEEDGKTYTTIKFLEYDVDGEPLKPRYFTFSGNIIQFQALVIRFEDIHIRQGDRLKGKSAYIFWKVFMLDGKNTQEYVINKVNTIPDGYRLVEQQDEYEKVLWEEFWTYALDPESARESGIKNAQIEAPGTMFVPGNIYLIRIEHDGGLRIDVSPLSPILRGERIIS